MNETKEIASTMREEINYKFLFYSPNQASQVKTLNILK